MARISTPAEEAERTKAEKARKANSASLWHTHSTDQLQLFVFTAWQVVFQETPDTSLLGLQLGLAANWHIADPEDFANQGPFLRNRQEGARLFMTLESAALACGRAVPPGSLSSALVAQVKTNINQFFRLRAQAVLEWCYPSIDTPHRRDVGLIAQSIVAQASGVRRAIDYAQQAIAERCAGHAGDPTTENAAFLAMARPFYEAYLRNGMSNVLAAGVVKQYLAFEPPPFLAAANGDTAAAWAAFIAARARAAPIAPGGGATKTTSPPEPAQRSSDGSRPSPARRRSPERHRSPPRQRSPDPTAWHNDELVPAARADLADYLRWTRVPLNRRCPVSIALIAAGP
jgi:hypothetical protein